MKNLLLKCKDKKVKAFTHFRMFGSIGYNHRSFASLSRTNKIVGSTDSSDVFFQSV
ncbi:hypothetical protein LEQ41_01150 [Streptococcus agalactiae]|nr:hypothetical protein CHF17_00284 [Streptococcus agalactiae]MCA5913779.1 hypothetical protein [Streptococcus agalactiae]MCA5915762.1 hypothetical protein [Streptococcus agalactiae]MCY7230267.1 hypothetical protein [Streptococcus agalactiae]CFQ26445.1 Uncharacterised protein [Streptococcus agalactiae]